jgi:aryl-alcohol dehydrogenase-like predicted oxidoreductase
MNIQKEAMITLGPTQVRVSPMGVGTNSWGVRRAADPGKLPAFKALMDAGVNLFDTAEIYTLGASERTLGHCIRAGDKTPIVLTKFFPLPWRWRKQDLTGALHASLERLGLAQVDVYLLHFPWPPVALEIWADALADVAHAGLARAVGISNCTAEQTRRAHTTLAARGVALACNEVEFSLLKRDPQSNGLLSLCHELDVTLIAYRPLAMGMLTGKYSTENPPKGARAAMFSRRYLAGLQPLISAMTRIGEIHGGKTASQVAINWVICKGALPIPGVKDLGQALQNAGALGWRLSEEEIAALEAAAP